MQFIDSFVPTAADVGLVAMLTEWVMFAAIYAFGGGCVFFAITRTSVAPRRRMTAAMMSVICGISAYSYWSLAGEFHDILHQLSATDDAAGKAAFVRDAYLTLAPYRYSAWAVTMPLLATLIALSLAGKPRELMRPLAWLVGAALLAVFAGYIGEQQIKPDGRIYIVRRCACGALALAGYVAVPTILLRIVAPRCGGSREHDDALPFRAMCWMTLTSWSVYPLAFLAPMILPKIDFNWFHLALTAGDVFNQLGIGAIAYFAGAAELEKRVPHEAAPSARIAT